MYKTPSNVVFPVPHAADLFKLNTMQVHAHVSRATVWQRSLVLVRRAVILDVGFCTKIIKTVMKGYWKRGSTTGSMDRNGIKRRRATVFRSIPGLVYSNSAFESRNRRPLAPSCTAQLSVCQWRHDEGRHVRQKCQIRHDTVFFCSLLGQSKPTWPRHGELNFRTETYLFW